MKKILTNKKILILIGVFFAIVFANTFLCYLVSYFAKNNSTGLYVIIPFILILFGLTVFILIIFLRKYSETVNPLLLSGLTIFAVAIIDTFIFKILSLTSTKELVQKTGFISIVILFSYFGVMLLISLLPIKKKKEAKVLEKQKI